MQATSSKPDQPIGGGFETILSGAEDAANSVATTATTPNGEGDESVFPSKSKKFVLPEHLVASILDPPAMGPDMPLRAPGEIEVPKIPTDGGVLAGNAPDGQVKAERNEDGDARNLPFPVVEPYPGPVNPAELFDEVSDTIRRFIVLEKEQADTATLWSAHTYLLECFDISPLAIIDAPEKECAKTIFQGVLGRMSYRPLPAANASASALFRSVELWTPTILFDEADTFFKDKPELQGMVNAGYKRGGFVLRSEAVGNGFAPKMFSVFCAKSVAGIALVKHLPDSTMSRGIVFNMRRKLRHEKVERLRYVDPNLFTTIAAKLARFAKDYAAQVRSARPVLPDELSDRAQDNWEPLLAIAACAGPGWIERATAAALKLSGDTAASTGNELLADIQGILARLRTGRIKSADLIDALCEDAEAAWATYNNGRPLTPRQLSKLLSVYGVSPKTVRQGKETPKGYDVSQFEDVFARYLAAPPDLPQRRNESPEAMVGKGVDVSDDLVGDWGDLDDPPERGGVADKPRYGPRVYTDDDF